MKPAFLPQKGTKKLTADEAFEALIPLRQGFGGQVGARTSIGIRTTFLYYNTAAFAQATRHWINHKERKNPRAEETSEALIRARETFANRTETLCSLWLKIISLQLGYLAAAPHFFLTIPVLVGIDALNGLIV